MDIRLWSTVDSCFMELEQNIEHTLLRHIRPYQITFKIRVRASRLWRPKKYNSDIYDGLHYLLVDEEGHAIHGLIEESAYHYMSNKMEEGQVYDITNFYNRKPISKYKVADHVVELCFNASTKFEPVMDAFPPIPEHSFNFLHFDNLEDQMRTQTVLKDVYGCIKSLIPEHQVTVRDTGKLESKCEIFVENLRREDIRITFWGDIARKFDMERVKQLSPPVLAVFTGLRLTKFQERVTAATTGHTCIIINPDIPIAIEYKAEFSKAGDKVKVLPVPFKQPTAEEMKDKTTKSVFELNTLDPDIYMNKTVYCTASILQFPVHNGWWYRGCSKCFKQLKQREDSGELICLNHDVQIAVPCYKVYVTIRDDNNQATLILMGRQAEQLFGINCQDLVNRRLYPTEQTLPEEIKKTTDETYLFEITVDEYSELMVRNIFPSKQSFASMVEQTPTTVTPEWLPTERKRNIEASGKALCIVEPEKKAKNEKETKRGAMISASSVSSSASKEQLQNEKAD